MVDPFVEEDGGEEISIKRPVEVKIASEIQPTPMRATKKVSNIAFGLFLCGHAPQGRASRSPN
jgi:hypothetical protein